MKYFLISLLLLLSSNCLAQIKISNKKDDGWKPTKKYDSLENNLWKDVHLYIGQTLYLPSCSMNSLPILMDNYKEYTDSLGYKRKPKLYKSDNYGIYVQKEAIIGKYYKVLDTVSIDEKYLDNRTYYLKLLNVESNDTIWYEYDMSMYKETQSFPFITLGYYEKLKQIKIGKYFKVANFQGMQFWHTEKYPTGELTAIPRYSKVKCIDVVIADESIDDTCSLSYIIEWNGKKYITPVSIEGIRYE